MLFKNKNSLDGSDKDGFDKKDNTTLSDKKRKKVSRTKSRKEVNKNSLNDNKKLDKEIKLTKEDKSTTSTSTSTSSRRKYVLGKPIRQSFEDFTQIPEKARIVSEDKSSKYFINDVSLRDHAIILEAEYAPNGVGDKVPTIILIFTNSEKSKLNIQELTTFAKEANRYLVADVKTDAYSFIHELKQYINSQDDGTAVVKEASGNRKRVINLFEDVLIAGASDLHIEVGNHHLQPPQPHDYFHLDEND